MSFHDLPGYLMILKETLQILPRNGKLMALVALVSTVLYSILILITAFAVIPLSEDIALKATSAPISPASSYDFTSAFPLGDLKVLFALLFTFFLGFFTISFFTSIAIIIISNSSYSKKTLSAKDLLLKVVKTWKRPLITGFYTTLLVVGYYSLFFTLFSLYWSISQAPSVAFIIIMFLIIGILVFVFYVYLSVVWLLSMVISVVEEKHYGMEALGKAAQLIKGNRLNGFVLNIIIGLVGSFFYLLAQMIQKESKSIWFIAISGLITVCSAYLVKILMLLSYTVLYFHCKKSHGEEIGVQESGAVEYTKLSSIAYEEA